MLKVITPFIAFLLLGCGNSAETPPAKSTQQEVDNEEKSISESRMAARVTAFDVVSNIDSELDACNSNLLWCQRILQSKSSSDRDRSRAAKEIDRLEQRKATLVVERTMTNDFIDRTRDQ